MPRHRRRTLAALLTVGALVTVTTASSPATADPPSRTADAFVQREGTSLTLQGEPFRFAGTNLYWLGLDENVGGIDHLTCFRTDDALKTVRVMNATHRHAVDCTPMRPAVMRPTPTKLAGETQFCSPTEEFVLSRLETGTEAVSMTDPGPQVLLCPVGHVRLTPGPTPSRGAAAFVPAGSPCEVTGGGAVLYRARVPLSAAS